MTEDEIHKLAEKIDAKEEELDFNLKLILDRAEEIMKNICELEKSAV